MTTENPNVRHIVAVAIGNALEWYDFAIYGYVAVTISKLFFPPATGWAPLLATFGLFAVSYVVRPIGGILLGHYADLYGRKTVLALVMGLMATGSTMIALAPTYRTVGVAAPLIVLIARILQGVSAGGEFSSATAFLVEHMTPQLRGLYGAWQFSGQGAAVLLSGVIGALVTRAFPVDQLESWGWRLPFVLGAIVGPIGLYIRLKLAEAPEFLRDQKKNTHHQDSIVATLTTLRRGIAIAFGLVLGGTAAFYVLFVFITTYAVKVLKLELSASLVAPIVAGAIVMICCPAMGYLSDRIGRRWVMGVAIAVFAAVVYPAFRWLQAAPTVTTLAVVEVGFGVLFSAYAGAFSAAIAELFPVRGRATAMAVAYNLGVSVFGGGAPFIVTWLIAVTDDPTAPAYYVLFSMALSLVAIAVLPTRAAPAAVTSRTAKMSLNRRQD